MVAKEVTEARKVPFDETDSWVYSYTSDKCDDHVSCACAGRMPAAKHPTALSSEAPEFAPQVVMTSSEMLKISPANHLIEVELCGKSTQGHEVDFNLTVREAWLLMSKLALAIGEITEGDNSASYS